MACTNDGYNLATVSHIFLELRMTTLDPQTLANLARRYGLGESYYDYRGEFRPFSDAARTAILRSMGVLGEVVEPDSPPSAPPIQLLTQEELFVDMLLPGVHTNSELHVQIQTETGESISTSHVVSNLQHFADGHSRIPIPTDLTLGYHQLRIQVDGKHLTDCTLIVAPPHCYEPESIRQGKRFWGLSIQLYTLRSDHNWGIGDFADLKDLIRSASPVGCSTIGLNPLHALRPADPAHISPYSPSHRDFLNVLYIAPAAAPEFQQCPVAQEFVDKHVDQLKLLRASSVVLYSAVADAKFRVFRALYDTFHTEHVTHRTLRAQIFRRFVEQSGEALRLHAVYDALDQYFSAQPGRSWGWHSWPDAFHDPRGEAVQQFAANNAAQVEYFMYLQWLARTQLDEAQQLACDLGMALGLYGDVAVGVDPNGSEVWSNRTLFVEGVAVGAPPDSLALKGQDWGIPPQHPVQLSKQAYQPFINMLRANMRSAGALRIDHVMTLCRLWWVPRGFEATEGVYVYYPLDDLMKLVALESVRNRCLVIGEDLGTVPDAMRHAMERFGLYHYKVLFFEKGHDGQFIAPQEYIPRALAVVTTHDLPPFRSWWQGDDIALRDQLMQYPDQTTVERVQHERDHDRRLLLEALTRAALWQWHAHEPLPPYSLALMRAAYLYAALSPAALLVAQPEDLMGMIDPVNVPGTSTEHPNWQRKLSEDLADTLKNPEVQEVMCALNKARRGESPN
jgi:4-alpha-glucanotransferase